MLLKAIILLFSFVVATQGASIGLSEAAYARTVCANGCSWNTPELYDSGTVPTAGDIVDLKLNQGSSSFSITINVDVPVVIQGFSFGDEGSSDVNFVLNIKSGNNLTVTEGSVALMARSTVVVENGASLIVQKGQATSNGVLSIAGTASFSGSNPALTLTYKAQTNPLNIVTPVLALNNGIITAPQGVKIDSLATNLVKAPVLTGVGNITGDVTIFGRFKPGMDDNTPGDIFIFGNLILKSSARIYFNIKSKTEFDHVYISDTINVDGYLILSPINKFEPLVGQRFYIMNHTEFIGGYNSVSGDGFTSLFNDKWSIRPDQENTIVVWSSAPSLVASVMVVFMCLVASLL
jgi:hypothetical protein